MAVKIRLARFGSKKRPFYRIVVAPKGCPRDGRFLEMVGTYNPIPEPAIVTLKQDKIQKWIDEGAVPSATVKSLLKKEGFYNKTTNA